MFNGKTVEVTNTDAEGRLILADAIAMAAEDEPDAIIDVATLTGPCIVALGEKVAGVFGDDETTAADLRGRRRRAARCSGGCRSPTRPARPSAPRARSPTCSSTTGCAGAPRSSPRRSSRSSSTDRPWAHLDIAGPAWNTGGPWGHVPSGATGYGISTLVEYVAALAAAGEPGVRRARVED